MKISLVILHADPARGGAERYTFDLATAMARRGHDVSLLACSFGPVIEGVRQQPMKAGGLTRLAKYGQFLNSVNTHLSTHTYDVVHAMLPVQTCDVYHPHAGLATEAVASGHLKQPGNTARTLSKLSNQFNRKRQRFAAIESELLGSVHPPVVLCLSNEMKKTVHRHNPKLDERRLVKLFNATDLATFDPALRSAAGQEVRGRFGLTSTHIVGLMLAQDFERKGLRQAIEALAKVVDARLVLLVAGKQDTTVYRQLAKSLGVADRVKFAGPTDDPYSFYKAADFFVLPTRHDPCSLVVLEALAMGVPVISTSANGACEIMEDHRHGRILTDPGDVPALAAAMREMLDGDHRNVMSRACLSLRPALSYESHLNHLEQIYSGLKR